MKKFITLVAILCHSLFHGQDINQDITPISTQAASFTKYIETPISHFNGTTRINIPIYTINEGSLNVPISLGYHSGGIKVNEEASWVGLGWSLASGGQITHIIKGRDDVGSYDFKNRVFPSPLGSEDTTDFPTNFVIANFYNEDGEVQPFFDTIWNNTNTLDGEADYYAYSFGGYSGKFLVDDGKIYDITGNSIRFEFTPQAITATTPEGIVYLFDVIERSYSDQTGFSTSTYFLSEISNPSEPDNHIRFYYKSFQEVRREFTSIFLDLPLESLPPQLPQVSQQYINSNATVNNPSGFKENFSKFFMDEQYLDRIEFRNGSVTFEKEPRNDKYGFALTRLQVLANGNDTPVKDIAFNFGNFSGAFNQGGDYLESINTDSYFYYPVDYRKNRLKLNGIIDYTDSGDLKEHSFTYYEDIQLPYKTSHAVDYWGYFNNAYGNEDLIPDYRRYVSRSKIPNTLSNWRGADREPDQENAISGTLKSITYPTKGTTDFEYELHTYTNLKDTGLPGGLAYVPTWTSAVDYNAGGQVGYIETEFEIVAPPTGDDIPPVDINVGLFCDSDSLCPANCGTGGNTGSFDQYKQYAYMYKLNANNQWVQMYENSWDNGRIEIYNCNDNDPRMHSYSRNLTEGKYRIRVNYPDNLQGSHNGPSRHSFMSVRYYHLVDEDDVQNFETGIGGGLRIAKITTTANDTGSTIEKSYQYEEGIMTRYPVFYFYENKVSHKLIDLPVICPDCFVLESAGFSYLYNTSVYPLSYSANGSLVGYKKVKEFNKRTNNVSDSQGEIHYEYFIEPDKYLDRTDPIRNTPSFDNFAINPITVPGTPSISNLKNGKLKSISYYYGDTRAGDLTGPLIKKHEYTYDILEKKGFWNMRSREQFHVYNPSAPNQSSNRIYYWRYTLYPVLLGKVVETKQTITENDFRPRVYPPVNIFFNQEIYTHYDSDKHLFPTKIVRKPNNDDDEMYHTVMIYPQDYNGGSTMIRDLVTANKVNQPVETVTYVNKNQQETVTAATLNTFHNKNASGFGKPKEFFSFEKNEQIALDEFKFSNVSSAGLDPHDTTARSNFSLSGIDSHYENSPMHTISYNSNGNIRQTSIRQEKNTIFVWGYNENYVIAKIENALYTSLSTTQLNAINQAVTAADNDTSIGTENTLRARLSTIRDAFPESMVSTYTYDPLIGITSMTDPRGYTTTYQYDASYRLEFVKDAQGNLVSENKYNYKN